MSAEHPDESDSSGDGEAGWECTRILAPARSAAVIAARVEAQLEGFDPDELERHGGATLSASAFEAVSRQRSRFKIAPTW